MTKKRYTKGNWKVCDDRVSVHSPSEDVIVATYPRRGGDNQPDFAAQTQEELEANATLIAAAPKMLNMLYKLLPYIEMAELDTAYKPGVIKALIKEIRSVINKAEGK